MSKEYDTDPGNYQICSVIGQCVTNIGTVYIARHLPTKSLVAVKKFNLEKISVDDTELIQVYFNCEHLLLHPYIFLLRATTKCAKVLTKSHN
jgi:serine/threonine protein kinase